MSTMVSTVFNCLKGDLSFTLFAVANLWFYFCNQKCWTSLIQWHFDLNFVFLYLWLLYLDTNQFRCSLSLAFYLLPLFHFHWIVEQVKAILRPFTRKHCENLVRPFVLAYSVRLSVCLSYRICDITAIHSSSILHFVQHFIWVHVQCSARTTNYFLWLCFYGLAGVAMSLAIFRLIFRIE